MSDTSTARQLAARNPRTGQVDYQFLAPSSESLLESVRALRSHQSQWTDAGVEKRIAVIKEWQQALVANTEKIVSALSLDTGRTALAERELAGLVGSIDRWCRMAPALLENSSKAASTLPNMEIFSDAEPYSLLGAISPWNFPLLLSFIDVVPALLAGCAACIKPSEVTPRFAAPVSDTIAAVPDLAKVLAIIPGDGLTGQELASNVDVVAFTGSVATGRKVAVAAAQSFIPAFLELGGKDPAVVLPGSDLDRASTAILRASVSATGQACQSLERIYVQRDDHDAFVELLVQNASRLELTKDDPSRGSVGPLIFNKQAGIIADQLEDAVSRGAVIQCGGDVIENDGAHWIEPTVVTNVDHSMKLMTEETFGPIMPVMAFDEVEHAVTLANDTHYGLSAAVFGRGENSALAVARKINAGGISVNDAGMTSMVFETEKSAFGYSGMGPSRVGSSGLTRFLRKKSLFLNRGEAVPLSMLDEKLRDSKATSEN